MPITSGISCDKEIVEAFKEMRDKRKYRYVIFSIRSRTTKSLVMINKRGQREEGFVDFLKNLPRDEPRYILYDFSYDTILGGGGKRERMLFIYWCPDSARVDEKTKYSTTRNTVLKELNQVLVVSHVELMDADNLNEEFLLDKTRPIRERRNPLIETS